MIKRETLIGVGTAAVEDGYGGYVESETTHIPYDCRISISNNVEIANQYGVRSEQVLNVVTDVELPRVDKYSYNGKIYEVRAQFPHRREFFSTLVEVV